MVAHQLGGGGRAVTYQVLFGRVWWEVFEAADTPSDGGAGGERTTVAINLLE